MFSFSLMDVSTDNRFLQLGRGSVFSCNQLKCTDVHFLSCLDGFMQHVVTVSLPHHQHPQLASKALPILSIHCTHVFVLINHSLAVGYYVEQTLGDKRTHSNTMRKVSSVLALV